MLSETVHRRPAAALRRVELRPASPQDAELLHRWRTEPSIRRHQPLHELSQAELRNEVANQRMSDLYRGRGEKFQWIVLAEGRPAGWVTLVVSNWEHGLAEIGYSLSSAFQGRGHMTEALSLLLEDLFTRTTLERIEAHCTVDNIASHRVLEKNGFRREGLLRGYFKLGRERVDNYLFGLLKADYLGRSPCRWP